MSVIVQSRKKLRLAVRDYNQPGYYFITICTQDRRDYFGEIINNEMILSDIGKIVKQCWVDISDHFIDTRLDDYIIMPNHLHGVIEIVGDVIWRKQENYVIDDVGVANLRPLHQSNDRSKMLLSKIIHGFKSSVTRFVNDLFPDNNFKWQRSYYDHIIRNEQSLLGIRKYIIDNPLN
jgi:REP element-mobilizing transposase RayT